jgi:cytochrome b561
MKPVSRYHWLVVLLHWLLAFYVIATLAGGFLIMAPMANTDPEKKRVLLFHMSFGMAIAGVMLLRFVVRLLTAWPAEATTGHAALDRLVPYAHYAFYVLIVLQAATGLTTAILAGLNRSVFQGTAEPLPPVREARPPAAADVVRPAKIGRQYLIRIEIRPSAPQVKTAAHDLNF